MANNIGIVYLAAGISSRFGHKSKMLTEIGENGESLIELSLAQSLKAGFGRIFFIVNDKTERLFKERFKDSYKGIPVFYSRQTYNPSERDKPWGTVDAICTLKGKIDCPFVVCNGDDLYGKETFKILCNHLLSQIQSGSSEAASVWYRLGDVIPKQGKVNRGIFKEGKGYVKRIREIFSIEREILEEKGLSLEDKCGMGIFALFPQTIEDIYSDLLKFKKENKLDRRKEYTTETEITNLIQRERLKMKLYPTNSKWLGVTNPEDINFVKKYLKSIQNII